MSDRQGLVEVCPKCGSPIITNEDRIEFGHLYLFASCTECDWDGQTIYELVFAGYGPC